MHTRWRTDGRPRNDVQPLQRGASVLALYVGSLWHHAARGAENDDPLRSLLLCALRRPGHPCKLGDVRHPALTSSYSRYCGPAEGAGGCGVVGVVLLFDPPGVLDCPGFEAGLDELILLAPPPKRLDC